MWGTGHLRQSPRTELDERTEVRAEEAKPLPTAKRDIGAALYAMAQLPCRRAAISRSRDRIAKDPIVIPNSHLDLIKKEEVPSQRDGVLSFIGTEVRPEDRGKYPPGKFFEVMDRQYAAFLSAVSRKATWWPKATWSLK